MKTMISRFFYYLLPLLLVGCGEVVVVVNEVPGNTPAGASVYVSGNFNYWDPGDNRYRLEMKEDSTWVVRLPKGFGLLEYKFTRGDWTTVEGNDCGYEISNRLFQYGDNDTIVNQVKSWGDLDPVNCDQLTLVLTNIPENTPDSEMIALAGDFNEWGLQSDSFVFAENDRGEKVLSLPRPNKDLEYEFKITRGNLEKAEADEYGHEAPVRTVRYGEQDTVFIEVKSWEDLVEKKHNSVTVVLNKLPDNTPDGAELFAVGDFNGWFPRDRNYEFKPLKDGRYAVTIPRKGDKMEFKITRGDWPLVEVDWWGNELDNRVFQFGEQDTMETFVENWKDLSTRNKYWSLRIDKLPEGTTTDARIYLAGNFNDWDPGNRNFLFQKNSRGQLTLGVPRKWKKIEYKFTRGNWAKVEGDRFGAKTNNRSLGKNSPSISNEVIDSWEDEFKRLHNLVTIRVTGLPENTPEDAELYIASSWNGWQALDPRFKMKRNANGDFEAALSRKSNILEFKITRGPWNTVEVNDRGRDIENRVFQFGNGDTVNVEVVRWKDLRN